MIDQFFLLLKYLAAYIFPRVMAIILRSCVPGILTTLEEEDVAGGLSIEFVSHARAQKKKEDVIIIRPAEQRARGV